ncbi:MAG: glycosyltransferase [Candidatus Omnitrophica bacterium]|nr:glycosyltransferase [Candidatus Omnitrophota bacterium]
MDKPEILLSVIIPCKNEEKNIVRCLVSLFAELKNIQGSEVLLVDSRSTDKSVEEAKRFPINIIQLKENWDISPAAARYVGCVNTSGKYRLFIDGDMELIPGFLDKAINFLQTRKQAAAVAGLGAEFYSEGGNLENMYQRKPTVAQVDFIAGAGLFKSEALDKAGYFNPFLKAEEEHELAQRLKKADYSLFTLPIPMINHYTSQGMNNFQRRLKAGMFKGIGQMFRVTLESGTFSFKYFLRFRWFIGFILILSGLIAAVAAWFIWGNHLLLANLLGFLVLIFLISWYSKAGIKKGILSLYKAVLINNQILLGLFTKTPDSSAYPLDIIIIKKEGIC